MKKKEDKSEYNLCRSCGKIIYGLGPCGCDGLGENQKLWSRPPRNSNKSRGTKLVVTKK